MRWWQRLILAFVGLVLLAGGGAGTAFDWSGVGLAAMFTAGVFVLLGAIVGAMPKGSFKEGNVEWPQVDKHPRVEALETEIATLRVEVATARAEAKEATDFLIDYIVAHEPPPFDDPDGGPLTDEERLEEMERGIAELSSEIDTRYFTGETYDDGVEVKDMERWRGLSRDRCFRRRVQ
nr:hypothetical protein [Pseudonocardia dioxanivorans]